MRAKRLATRLLALVALSFVPWTDASACSCAPSGAPCQNTFQTDAVFSGTVRSITEIPADGPPLRPNEMRFPRGFRVEFDIISAYRGIEGSTTTILTAGSGPACGYSFKQGERYLVYAYRRDGDLVTGICSRTGLLAQAGDDIRFLETLSLPGTSARLYGTVRHWEQDLATGQPQDHGSMRDVHVRALGATSAFDARTDASGAYEIALPPGKYEVAVLPPAGYSERYLTQTVELRDARACFAADFGVRFDGRIRGIVRQSSGEPAAGISVDVMAAQDVVKTGYTHTAVAVTDAEGRFEFLEVSPGRYVVGVDLTRKMSPKVVFPTTFHPGTPDPARATIVELTGGQHRELQPMMLPAARREYRIAGTVFFEDGKPAPRAFIAMRDASRLWQQVAIGTETAADGTFSFVAHEGLDYVVNTTYWDEARRQQLVGTSAPLVITGDVTGLKLMLSQTTYRAQ
jgi:hypothetical protein